MTLGLRFTWIKSLTTFHAYIKLRIGNVDMYVYAIYVYI